MSSLTILDIPSFVPNYDRNMSYGYKGLNGANLLDLLYSTTGGYCMYCYSRIEIDSKRFGHLEHSIEKRHSSIRLLECVPNIGLACPKCNLSFKKVGDKVELFTKKQIESYEQVVCTQEKCTKECSSYKRIKRIYLKKRKIILQPMGVITRKHIYRIQYNLLKLSFEPSIAVPYIDEEKEFINQHIAKFNLNDSKYRTRELLKFCEDMINGDRYLRNGKYNNYIVDLFMDKLKNLDEKARVKLCGYIYMIGKSKRII
ncbi:hypothetical protein [Clostridium estertheticum]|uniref:Uncharacterized protein n=1 Tax=Clostridium estertheticum TaxID=238834 RepID=A0AA47EEN1_9CLOT|nr:hypothetical protein [Clostridium estertheticum]MBU3154995.1 hypothetical protein [Clostridium estertheticum]WAG58814.1 hypothetical protein LL038_14245 [Clostridium estertheticum]